MEQQRLAEWEEVSGWGGAEGRGVGATCKTLGGNTRQCRESETKGEGEIEQDGE